MKNKYTSEELFHFVGHSSPQNNEENYKKLCLLLEAKCISHPPHDGSWGSISYTTDFDNQLATEELIVPSVTCYADIPFDSLSTHVRKYGKFGVSLPTCLLIEYGARPVTYIPMRSDDWRSIYGLSLIQDIEAIVQGFNEQVVKKQTTQKPTSRSLGKKPDSSEAAISAVHNMLMKDFLAFLKPFNSELPLDDPDNYYLEREWRKFGNMKFELDQISRIIVARGYKTKLKKEYPEYSDFIYEI